MADDFVRIEHEPNAHRIFLSIFLEISYPKRTFPSVATICKSIGYTLVAITILPLLLLWIVLGSLRIQVFVGFSAIIAYILSDFKSLDGLFQSNRLQEQQHMFSVVCALLLSIIALFLRKRCTLSLQFRWITTIVLLSGTTGLFVVGFEEQAVTFPSLTPICITMILCHIIAIHWRPTSSIALLRAESALLHASAFSEQFPCTWSTGIAGPLHYLRMEGIDSALSTQKPSEKPPLVLIHGFGAGKGAYFQNLHEIAANYRCYAIDQIGTGLSNSPNFHICFRKSALNTDEAEDIFVEAIESWRKEMNLQSFYLLGHSFGGFISAVYTMRYPDNVRGLILASPVGIPHEPTDWQPLRGPFAFKIVASLWNVLTPQDILQFFGPFGPFLAKKVIRMRLLNMTWWQKDIPGLGLISENTLLNLLSEYFYHLSVLPDSIAHSIALSRILSPGAWARNPLIDRIPDNLKVKTCFLYGKHDWMDSKSGKFVANEMKSRGIPSQVHILERCGHQLFLTNPPLFNRIVIQTLDQWENQTIHTKTQDIKIPSGIRSRSPHK